MAQRHLCKGGARTTEVHLRTMLGMPSGPWTLNDLSFLMQWWTALSGSVEKGRGVGGGSELPGYGGRWCSFGGKNTSLRMATSCWEVSCVAMVSLEADLVYSIGMHVQLLSDSRFFTKQVAFQMSCLVIPSSQPFQCIALSR